MASGTKWTPGPWVAKEVVGIPDEDFWSIIAGNQEVAIAPRAAHPEREANAALIAAAPDLFEALAWFLEDTRFQVSVGGNPIVVERMLANARAALAKARAPAATEVSA